MIINIKNYSLNKTISVILLKRRANIFSCLKLWITIT